MVTKGGIYYELGCAYLDCNAPLLDEEGFLKKEMMADPIHFSSAGYVEVLKILEPYL
jgi:lysophospholipase L1-like esterase